MGRINPKLSEDYKKIIYQYIVKPQQHKTNFLIMKTTLNIHLAQRLIVIDTDAWQRLEQYLNALKKYFTTQDSGDEIYADIENRISEIMHLQLKSGKVSISDKDAQEIIEKVGDLKTLGIEEPEPQAQTNANQSNTNQASANATNQQPYQSSKKRLVRNANDKIISGLCAGIANYMNVDPIWIRLIFLFLLLPAGIGFIAYILGSIFIPKSYDAVFNGKRLYRDTDSKMIGGVCSGIGAYFNTNPNYIRVLFLSPIIISIITNRMHFAPKFGAVNAPFVGIYILLLILLPKAKTATEKLLMRGQQVNVNTIRNQVNGQVPPPIVRHSSVANIFGVLIKGLLYCFVGFLLFITSIVGIALLSSGSVVMQFSDYLFRSGHQTMLANFGWILFCATPLVFVILLIVKKVNGRQDYLPRHTFSYLGLAWIFGLFCLIALGKEFYKDFKISKTLPAIDSMSNTYTGNTLRVKLSPKLTNESFMIGDVSGIHLLNDSAVIGNVNIDIQKSFDTNYHFSTSMFARGNSNEDINTRLQFMQFQPVFIDSVLQLPLGYVLKKGQLWRGQKINLTIYVPVGKQILIEEGVNHNYSDIELNTSPGNFSLNSHNNFEYDTDIWYTMQTDKLFNADEQLSIKQSEIEDAKEQVEKAADEVAEKLEDAKTELNEKLENAKTELDKQLGQSGSTLNKEETEVLKNRITKLQTNLDSLQIKLDANKNILIDKAKEALDEAKKKLDEKKSK
jgi:phage shock protein PspC (stress-responsive transcriptional regulator)